MLNVISGLLSGGAAAGGGTSYESIATVTVGSGGSSSISFSSIPSTYKHLQVRALVRSDRATTLEGAWAYFNTDTTNSPGSGNYTYHTLTGDGSTASAGATVPTQGGVLFGIIPGSSSTASAFCGFVADILDYTDTNKYAVTRSLTGVDLNGSGQIRFTSGLWRNTAAINAITFNTQGGGNFTEFSKFALYGIKG